MYYVVHIFFYFCNRNIYNAIKKKMCQDYVSHIYYTLGQNCYMYSKENNNITMVYCIL